MNNCCDPTIDGKTGKNNTLITPNIMGGVAVNLDIGIDCAGNRLLTGRAIATCEDLAAAEQRILDNLPKTLGVDCLGADVLVGATLVTCDNLSDRLVETLDTSITYTDAAIAGLQKQLVDCEGNPLAVSTPVPTCAQMDTAVDAGVAESKAYTDAQVIKLQDCEGTQHVTGNRVPTCAQMQTAIDAKVVVHDQTLNGSGTAADPLKVALTSQALGTLTPTESSELSVLVYGDRAALLGAPARWAKITFADGTTGLIPVYPVP